MFIFVYVFSRGSFLASSYEHGRTSVFRGAHVTSTQRGPSSEGEKGDEEEERIPGADKGDRQRRDSLPRDLSAEISIPAPERKRESERERERERNQHANSDLYNNNRRVIVGEREFGTDSRSD